MASIRLEPNVVSPRRYGESLMKPSNVIFTNRELNLWKALSEAGQGTETISPLGTVT